MSAVTDLVITNSGAALLELMKTKIGTFTKLVIGDGYNLEADFATVESIVNPVFELDIVSYEKDSDSGVVTLYAEFDNTAAEEGFWYRELGLYAKDPDTNEEILFAYGNANDYAEYIPAAETEKATIRKSIVLAISVANTDNVTVSLNSDYSEFKNQLEKKADIDLSNLINTGKSQYNPFCINTGDTDDNGNPACITLTDNVLTTAGTFICSSADGSIYEISDTLALDISDYADGDYNIFINPDVPELYLADNTIYTGSSMPSTAVTGDYLLNTSKVPYSLEEQTESGVQTCTAPNAVFAGVLTVSGGGE